MIGGGRGGAMSKGEVISSNDKSQADRLNDKPGKEGVKTNRKLPGVGPTSSKRAH